MEPRLKLALLGCGGISYRHLAGIRSHAARTDVVAVIDTSSDRAAGMSRETGAPAFGSLAEAVGAVEIDAVDIMVPHDAHEALTLEALEAGLHVLLEKPIAPTLESARRVLAAGQRARGTLMIAENSQYWPDVVKTLELLEAGAIGPLQSAHAAYVQNIAPSFGGADGGWRFARGRAGGGIAIDGCSHWIRPLRMFFAADTAARSTALAADDIAEIVAATDRPVRQMEGESQVRALLRFRSGRTASLEAYLSLGPVAPTTASWRLIGEAGEIVVGSITTPGLTLYNREHPKGRHYSAGGYLDSFGPELADFEAVVLDGKPPAAGPERALGELATALAIYRSVETGRWEPVLTTVWATTESS